jgi:primosomal protein N' (replication factor Y)
MNRNPIARVVMNLSLDREFDYRIPEEFIGRVRVGSKVKVPFGRGKSMRTAYVVGLKDHSDYPNLKFIATADNERAHIPDTLVRLAQWMSEYYCCAREQAVRAMLPAVVRTGRVSKKREAFLRLNPELDLADILPELETRAPKQAAIIQTLVREGGHAKLTVLLREADTTASTVKALEKKDFVIREREVVARDPFADDVVLPTKPLDLTPDQKQALGMIVESLDSTEPDTILLHGVTGSGKTEVYLQAIAHCLESGREAIVLVPEISLTPQTVERFRSRFGDQVSVLHSALGDGERFDEWTRIHEGRSRIVVGARSALFAPFVNVGLIVVDEEHETTYKQDEAPRYNARDIAVMRGKMESATVLLGTATPSLESWNNCRVGKYKLATLPKRIDDRLMPVMEVVDMRAEAALRGGAQIFSRRLEDEIGARLDRGEQTILFLNRRGYARQMMCQKCGHVAMCEDCTVSYTYHRQAKQLMCHLCGRVKPAPEICPQCADPGIRYTGLGTEKIESIAQQRFKKAVIARMDSDTMTTKNAYRKTLDAFRAGRIHILIGTQMIAKGLDFPNVTLVGIIFADQSLYVPDFRAGERTFQLLTQVSGRAGRGDVPGRVIVQSYTPFHPALNCAIEHNFKGFVDEELEVREALDYPPATHMAIMHFRGEEEIHVHTAAQDFVERLRPRLSTEFDVVGPLPAPIARVRNKFRYQIQVRGARILRLGRILREMVVEHPHQSKGVDVFVDIDPQSLM